MQLLPSAYHLEKVIVKENQIKNVEILVNNSIGCFLINNQIENSKITNYINNFYLLNNKINFSTTQDFGYKLNNNNGQENICYIYGNNVSNCLQEGKISDNITIIDDISEINNKLKENELEGI